ADAAALRPPATRPTQPPVSCPTFSTGINPGRTEIFDFLKRIDGTYVPEFAMATESRKPFLMGSRTPLVAGSAVGWARLLAGGAAAWLARRARRFVAIGTVLLAVAGGTGA